MQPAGEEAMDKRLALLEGACTVLSRDWWSYEWCHRKEVRQFHLNMPTHPTQEVRIPRLPCVCEGSRGFSSRFGSGLDRLSSGCSG